MTEPDEYYSFSDEDISSVLQAARQPYEERDLRAITEISTLESPNLTLLAQCISVTVNNHRVCLNLPLGIGRRCIRLPFNIPNGTAAQACLSICTIFGIPTGVCVRVRIGGVTVVNQCFGFGC
jgi:hypothetical protein